MNYTDWKALGMQPGDIVKVDAMHLQPEPPMLTPAPNMAPPRPPAPQLTQRSATVDRMESDHLYVRFVDEENTTLALPYKQIVAWHPRSEFANKPQ
jgi:hypothetical protein